MLPHVHGLPPEHRLGGDAPLHYRNLRQEVRRDLSHVQQPVEERPLMRAPCEEGVGGQTARRVEASREGIGISMPRLGFGA